MMNARWEAGRVASSCWESITAAVWSQIANTKQIQTQLTTNTRHRQIQNQHQQPGRWWESVSGV